MSKDVNKVQNKRLNISIINHRNFGPLIKSNAKVTYSLKTEVEYLSINPF